MPGKTNSCARMKKKVMYFWWSFYSALLLPSSSCVNNNIACNWKMKTKRMHVYLRFWSFSFMLAWGCSHPCVSSSSSSSSWVGAVRKLMRKDEEQYVLEWICRRSQLPWRRLTAQRWKKGVSDWMWKNLVALL